MGKDIEGRYEIVTLYDRLYNGCKDFNPFVEGEVLRNGEEVLVRCAIDFVSGTQCLARFKTKEGTYNANGRSEANFITSYIPNYFKDEGHEPYDVFLLAHWPDNWPFSPLTFEAINEVYDPGQMGRVPYFKKNGEGIIIYANGWKKIFLNNHLEALGQVSRRKDKSKIILSDSLEDLAYIFEEVRKRQGIPIIMESLDDSLQEL